jgi:hypothetical protein
MANIDKKSDKKIDTKKLAPAKASKKEEKKDDKKQAETKTEEDRFVTPKVTIESSKPLGNNNLENRAESSPAPTSEDSTPREVPAPREKKLYTTGKEYTKYIPQDKSSLYSVSPGNIQVSHNRVQARPLMAGNPGSAWIQGQMSRPDDESRYEQVQRAERGERNNRLPVEGSREVRDVDRERIRRYYEA